MAIKLHSNRNGIGRKIIFANLTTLVITLTVVFLAFSLLVPLYFRETTRADLKRAGEEIVKALDAIQDLKADTADDRLQRIELLKKLQEIRIAGRLVNARLVLVDEAGSIRLTNIEGLEPDELSQAIADMDSGRSSFIYTRTAFRSSVTGSGGALYLFARTEDVSGVNRGVLAVLLGCLLLGGVLAFGLGLLLQKRIRKPLETLVSAVESYSIRDFSPVAMESDDEFQILSEAFNRMAHNLKLSEETQIRLLQDISHELKTPLMSVQGYAEAIRDGVLSGAEADKSLDVIIGESQRLKRLVEELLLLTRLENQPSSFRMIPCSASETVGYAIDAAGGYARERGIVIRLNQLNDFTFPMDQDRMIQCLVNVIGNGIRYAVKEIQVSLDIVEAEGIIIIADDGRGFAPGELEQVFNRFYRGSQGGAGMGLTIARAILEGHGGAISAKNRADGGAEFVLRIPLHNQ